MERFIRLDKPDFIGRDASLAAKQRGPRIKLVYLAVEAADSDCAGNEPVYAGEQVVGLTTSGAYGHAVGKSLAFAYVEPRLAQAGNVRRPALRRTPQGAHHPGTDLGSGE